MTIQEIVLAVTGKPAGVHLSHGFFAITASQARKMTNGKLPRIGWESCWSLVGGTPTPANRGEQYVIARDPAGSGWTIREGYKTPQPTH